MSRVAVDGARYEVRVGGDGPSVLLLHGFTGRGADWAPFLPALRRVATTVVVDLLGHGRSDAPVDPGRHRIERQADDLAFILERLGLAPANVVGYSFGARLALAMILDRPRAVSGLLLESPSAGFADPAERAERHRSDLALADRFERDPIESSMDAWAAQPLFDSERALSPAARARLRAARLRNRPAGLAASLRGAGQGSMPSLHRRLASIAVPTTVIAGALDATGLVRARVVAGAIPGARLVVVEKAGHAPHREAPSRFRDLLCAAITPSRRSA